MNKQRLLTPSVIASVALLHLGLVSLLWQADKPVQMEAENIEFVDLGDFGGGDGNPEGAAQPVAVPPPVAPPPPPPKPAEPEKPVIQPVVTKKAEADIHLPKDPPKPVEKPKPEEKVKVEEKPKPVETPKAEVKPAPVAKPVERPSETTGSDKQPAKEGGGNASGNKEGGRGEGSGKGSGGAKGDQGEGNGGPGGGTGPGSSKGNPVKANGSIPQPPYPTLSLEAAEEGTVVLSVLVAPGGNVVDVDIVKSSGYSRLDKAAKNAAKAGRFNTNVWTQFRVPVRFHLE